MLLVTNYILLGTVATVRCNVYGDFNHLCPLFLESQFRMIYVILVIRFPTEFISYQISSSQKEKKNIETHIACTGVAPLTLFCFFFFVK